MSNIIDGKEIARKIRAEIKSKIASKKNAPGLAVVIVGNDPASLIYVKNKKAACEEVGIKSFEYNLPENTKEDELLSIIGKLNSDKNIHGILVQLPLPKHMDSQKIISAIGPEKDVDGFNPVNAGRLFSGQPGLRPCTPLGIMELINSTGVTLTGANAVVIGRSNTVGKPIAVMLLEKHATVTICHSKTLDIANIVRRADIVVAALGKPEFIKGDWIKKGAVVIDVGINRLDSKKIAGDVDFAAASKNAAWITPVPGGVGPMTIAMLLKNTLKSYETYTVI
ncbi:MAG: bifunctional methylenetetrahydrofolate dehydrogenase/methenyltetrahydrofolate cyclohydrolase FolD [Deltaproteobacteria bacterium]|nr:bifunctional methylenetetrahydrofolate dehydrogenase/methenyltetrahydrofolate cyclohydrolase FolD [Deltaproteobacteria bacterium]